MGGREGGREGGKKWASRGGVGNRNHFHFSRSFSCSVDLEHSMKEKNSFVAFPDCKLRALAASVKEWNFDLARKLENYAN